MASHPPHALFPKLGCVQVPGALHGLCPGLPLRTGHLSTSGRVGGCQLGWLKVKLDAGALGSKTRILNESFHSLGQPSLTATLRAQKLWAPAGGRQLSSPIKSCKVPVILMSCFWPHAEGVDLTAASRDRSFVTGCTGLRGALTPYRPTSSVQDCHQEGFPCLGTFGEPYDLYQFECPQDETVAALTRLLQGSW